MAITETLLESGVNATNSTDVVTGTFKPTAGRLVVATFQSRRGGATPGVPSLSGNNITWSQKGTRVYDSTAGNTRITDFAGISTAPTSGALTATLSNNQAHWLWVIDEYAGISSGGTTVVVVQSVTAGTTSATSISPTLAAFGSTNNATRAAFGNRQAAMTASTGMTEVAEVATTAENSRVMVEWKASRDLTPAASWSGNQQAGALAMEIKASTAGSTATTKTITASIDASIQPRPDPPTITGAVPHINSIDMTWTNSTQGFPSRLYSRVSATSNAYVLDGQTTVGASSWAFLNKTPNTAYDLGITHYNTTGRIESLFEGVAQATTFQATLLAARRVSGTHLVR